MTRAFLGWLIESNYYKAELHNLSYEALTWAIQAPDLIGPLQQNRSNRYFDPFSSPIARSEDVASVMGRGRRRLRGRMGTAKNWRRVKPVLLDCNFWRLVVAFACFRLAPRFLNQLPLLSHLWCPLTRPLPSACALWAKWLPSSCASWAKRLPSSCQGYPSTRIFLYFQISVM